MPLLHIANKIRALAMGKSGDCHYACSFLSPKVKQKRMSTPYIGYENTFSLKV
jgi:hypothetical protein